LIRCQECSPSADNITRTLERLGVIKVVRSGDQNPVGKASEFRYLLSQTKNCAENNDRGMKFRQSCQQSEVESWPRQYDNPEDALDQPEVTGGQ
jgi:hypothetical protein